MATKTLAIRDAIITALGAIGTGTGWDSGSGTPQIAAGGPPTKAMQSSPARQIWVQHGGTDPDINQFPMGGGAYYSANISIFLVCPGSGGEDMASHLERDCRRAIQLAQQTLQGTGLASAGLKEGPYEVRPELQQAGVFVGLLHIYGDFVTAQGDP